MTSALQLRKHRYDVDEIVVLDPRPDFTFSPSLIRLPFGIRTAGELTFPLSRSTPARAAMNTSRR